MDLGRYLIEAHLREGRPIAELAAAHGVHRSWLYKLLARYRAEGDAGPSPRSRRPHRSPSRIGHLFEDEIVALRKELLEAGRRRRRRAHPRARPRSHQGLRADRLGLSTMSRDSCPRCLATSQRGERGTAAPKQAKDRGQRRPATPGPGAKQGGSERPAGPAKGRGRRRPRGGAPPKGVAGAPRTTWPSEKVS